jgi:hypothetical protein
MGLLNWLKPLFERQVRPEPATTRFSLDFQELSFNADQKTIRIDFKTSNSNEDVQALMGWVLAAVPDQNAFHTCISNVSNDQKSRITISLMPTDPDNVSNLHLKTFAKMLARHIKTDLAGENPEKMLLLAPPSNTFT